VRHGLYLAAQLMPVVIPIALVVAAIWFGIAYLAHNRLLDLVTGAKRVRDRAESPRLWDLTETLCIARGMAMPRLAIIETPARNAFAAGLSPKQGSVTVTRGLMEALDDRELSAVIAHELAHIRNGDARLGVIAAVFVGVITLITDMVWQGMKFGRFRIRTGGSRDSRSGGIMIALIAIAIVIAVLAHMLALVLRMALSRNREYLADAGAVEMTGDADAMIGALRKVEQSPAMEQVPDQVRAMFLHDAVLSKARGWFATHPPIEDRIGALVRFAGGRDPGKLPELVAEAPPEVLPAAPAPWSEPAMPAPEAPAASAPQSPAWSPRGDPSPGSPWAPRGPG
jgi:heat shock protein HtpX